MSELRSYTRGTARLHVWEQTVDVCTPEGSTHFWFGRPVTDSDIDALCQLMDLGAKAQVARVKDALSYTSLFPEETP